MKCFIKTFAVALLSAVCVLPSYVPQSFALEPHGVAAGNVDHSVKPGDDFFRFANGEWIKRTDIPPDRAGVDVSTKIQDMANKRTADLIAELAKSNPAAGSSTRKVADLYNSYMDEAGIEAKGITPLKPHLDAIAAIRDKRELARALGETLRADVDALNTPTFIRPTYLEFGSRPVLRIRITTMPISCREVWCCPTASITSPIANR